MAYPFVHTAPDSSRAKALSADARRGLLRRKRRSSGLLPKLAGSAGPRRDPAHHVLFEPLEPRLLLSADLMPFHVDMADADIGDDITLRLDSSTNTLEIYQNANPAVGPMVSQKLNETSEIVIQGVDDRDDTLTVDYTDPFFLDISFDGGAAGFDTLVVKGGEFDSGVFSAESPDSGTVELTDGAETATISYTGLEPVDIEVTVPDVVFNTTADNERIVLSDHPDAGYSQIDSAGAELHKFLNAGTVSVTINSAGGNNTFVIEQLDSNFVAGITLNGGTGTDTVEVARDTDFTLSDSAGLTFGTQSVTLSSLEVATLSGGNSGSTFDISGWTGAATLTGGTAADTVRATGDGAFTLTDTSLTIGAQTVVLIGFDDADEAELTGGNSGNTFDLSDWTGGATLTGGTGTDIVKATGDGDFTLSDSGLTVGSQSVGLIGFDDADEADLTGGDGNDVFMVSAWSGTARINGGLGDDIYKFGDGSVAPADAFGTVELTNNINEGEDTLDFRGHSGELTIADGGATITSDDLVTSTVVQLLPTSVPNPAPNGELVEIIEADLLAADVDQLQEAIFGLKQFILDMTNAAGNLEKISNQLPLLDRGKESGLADVVFLTDVIDEFVDKAVAAILDQNQPASQVVAALNGLSFTLPTSVTSMLLKVTSRYRDVPGPGDPELLFDFNLTSTAVQTVDIDLGEAAENIGVSIGAKIDAIGSLDADFSIGLDAAGAAFLAKDSKFGLEVDATASLTDTPILLSFLELSGIGSLGFGGRIEITLDADNKPVDFNTAVLTVSGPLNTFLDTDNLTVEVKAKADPGDSSPLMARGVDLSTLGNNAIAFGISLPGGADDIFGDIAGNVAALRVAIDADIDADGIDDLDLLDFSNITPSEILGMLGEVADLLGSIAGSQFLEIGIPFTELSLGDVLDIGDSFKETVLDPLFTSGDALRPDNNEDGTIDANDLTFTSIQGLLDRLEDVLDPDGDLGLEFTALYDSGAHVSTSGVADQTQKATVHNAKGGTFQLQLDTFGTTGDIAWDAAAEGDGSVNDTSVKKRLNDMLGAGAAVTVSSVKLDTQGNGDRVYEIEFSANPNSALTASAVALDEVDDPHRELTFAIQFGLKFGFGEARVATKRTGGEGLDEIQTVTVNAVDSGVGADGKDNLADEFTLGIRSDANGAPFFTSGIAHDASAAAVKAALESLGVTVGQKNDTATQVVRLKNTAGNATFKLTHSDGRVSDAIALNADELAVAKALLAQFGAVTVTVTDAALLGGEREYELVFGNDPGEVLGATAQVDGKGVEVEVTRDDDVYEITFKGGFAETNVATLVSDSTQLMGAFGFDLGASLGDLASVETSGSFSPLVTLDAGITFGLDLAPSQTLTIVPPTFSPAPRVSVVTVQEGGGGTAEKQIVTVRGANDGTFTLLLGDKTISDIPYNVPPDQAGGPPLVEGLKQRLNAVLTEVMVDTVELDDTKDAVRAYTITFVASNGDVRELQGEGSLLKGAADNGLLVAEANFKVELSNDAFEIAGAGKVTDEDAQTVKTITVSVSIDSDDDNETLEDLRDDVQAAINEQLVEFGLGFLTDGELSTGARGVGDPTLEAGSAPPIELRNDLEFSLVFEQQVATAAADADDDTGTVLNDADALFTTKVKVGDIVVRVSDGARGVVQSIEDGKITHTALDGAAGGWTSGEPYEIRRVTEITSSLRAVDVLDGEAEVAVALSAPDYIVSVTNAGGGTFELTVDGKDVTIDFDAPAGKEAEVEVDATDLSKQVVTVIKATDGTFTLTDGINTTGAIAHDALATGADSDDTPAFDSVSAALTSAGITFESVSRSQTDNDVTFIINFADDQGPALVEDDTALQGNSVDETLVAAGVTGVTVTLDADGITSDNVRKYTLTGASTVSIKGHALEADGLLLDEDGTLSVEADRNDLKAADDYEAALQVAIDAALGRLKTAAEANAFEGTEFGDFEVAIGAATGLDNKLTFTVTSLVVDGISDNHTLELRFRNPIQVDAGGGRLAMSAPSVLYSTSAVEQGTRIDRSLRTEITDDSGNPRGYDDAAYQQLGLLTAPTSFTGVITDDIELQLVVNDVPVDVRLDASATESNMSIDELVAQLEFVVDTALAGAAGLEVDDITVGLVDAEGNRIQFKGSDTVSSLQIIVPATLTGGGDNGAITELGFEPGEGGKKRGKATEFFIEDVGFSGDFYLVAGDLSATATLGFLGIKASGSGTIGDAAVAVSGTPAVQIVDLANADDGTFTLSDGGDRTTAAIDWNAAASGDADSVQAKLLAAGFTGVSVSGGDGGPYTITFASGTGAPDALLEADDDELKTNGLDDILLQGGFGIELKNPEDAISRRLTPSDIVGAFERGDFFFDSEELFDDGKTGIVDGYLSGAFGLSLGIAPDGFLSGLKDDLNASIVIGLESPNWLEARPSLGDELGFGDAKDKSGNEVEGPITFTNQGGDDLFTLGDATPENGQLENNLSFMVSDLTNKDSNGNVIEVLGVLKASDTKPEIEVEIDDETHPGNEVQVVRILKASGGTFTLGFGDQVTRKLLYDAPDTGAGSVESALEALAGVGDVTVVKDDSKQGLPGSEIAYTVTFVNVASGVRVAKLRGIASGLTRGRADLRVDLQKAINVALQDLGSGRADKIRVSLDGDGKIRLAGDTNYRIRQNSIEIDFTGPDFEGLLARFKDLSFEDVIFALQQVVDFLQTLDGSNGEPAKIEALTIDLPLIERSISDMLDPAEDFLDFVADLAADPAGSVQKLNVIIANLLGVDAPSIEVDASSTTVQTLKLNSVSGGSFTLTLGGIDVAGETAGSTQKQIVTLSNASTGSFKLLVSGTETDAIAWNAVADSVKEKLEDAGIAFFDVTGGFDVTSGVGVPYIIDFGIDDPGELLTANVAGLELPTTEPIVFGIEGDADVEGKIEAALEALLGLTEDGVTVAATFYERVVSSNVTYEVTFKDDPGAALSGNPQGLASLNVLSLDTETTTLNIDFGFGIGASLTRPFSLDLADVFSDLNVDFLADFVGVDASGTLSLDAGVDLDLAFGIDLSGNDKGIFLRVLDTGIDAHANGTAGDLNFSAKLGPFGVFVVDGEAGIGGEIGFGLVNTDADGRFDLVRFGSAVSVEALKTGEFDKQVITVRSAGDGNFTLALGDETTGAIEWDAPASGTNDSVESKLEALDGIGDVTVSKAASGGETGVSVYTVTFIGTPPTALLKADGENIERSDLGRVGEFLSLELNPEAGGGLQVEFGGAAVLPLFIGTESDQIPIDFFDADGPGDDNYVVATFDALEIFDDDTDEPNEQPDSGISVDFASVSPDQSYTRDLTPAQEAASADALKATILALGPAVSTVVRSENTAGDTVFTITFAGDADKLIAISATGGLIVHVKEIGPEGSPGRVQELSIDAGAASGTFRVATPATGGVDFFSDLELPGIFALLSDPAVVVDGLDRVLVTIQDALNGQVFGVDLPFVSDLLAENPAANIIGDFRTDLLKPLANTIRENNLNLDGLISVIKETLFDILGPDGINLLQDRIDDEDTIKTVDDIRVLFLGDDGQIAPVLTATSLQFDFDLGQAFDALLADIEFDLGIDALGIEVDLAPRLELDWNLHVGFGVDQSSGFYFVSEIEKLVDGILEPVYETEKWVNGEPVPIADGVEKKKELDLNVEINFGGAEQETRIDGRLIFLALGLIDGIDTDGDGIRDEFTRLYLDGGIDLADPDGDGRLTFSEMTSASLSDIFRVEVSGGAELRIDAMVDFSTIDKSLGNVLPKISTDIIADFLIEAALGEGITVNAPEVAFLDVTLDLGSFISDFAGPILEAVAEVLGPLDFLIGPDGFLNKRIPLLSDLLGKTVTGKDLVVLYDPVRGPQVVAFLDFVDDLYFLATLVTDAAEEAKGGNIMINFGDVVLMDHPGDLDLIEGGKYVDQLFEIGLPSGQDLRDLKDLNGAEVPSAKDIPPPSKPTGSKTSSFTKGVTESGSIMFPILQPENVFKLLMGQTTTLVQIELPEFGFDFFYRQLIPIYGPIVGTVAGGVSANIDMGFGYDTLGLEQFLITENPANLINGFFLADVDLATGFDRVEVTLNLEIAVGAALSLGFITAGVEGGIAAEIEFNLSDLNQDGKVRLDEMAANIAANLYIPIAIFDVSGQFELFLRAFYEINLGLFSIDGEYEFARVTLFEFDIPFVRPAILGVQNGDTLTLNIGPNAEGRLNGDLNDGNETIYVKTKSDGSVVVWSSQFNVDETIAGINPFVGVKKIVVDGGAGNDYINLSGVRDENITIEASGGDGNDRIVGGAMAANVLRGGGGRDELTGGNLADELYGDAGNDTLKGLNNPVVPVVRIDREPGETRLQRVKVVSGTGAYTLVSDGVATDPIGHGATADQVRDALRAAQIFEALEDENGELITDMADNLVYNVDDRVEFVVPGEYLIHFATAPLRPMQAVGVDTDKLFGGDGDDTLDGGLGDDLLDGGLGDDTFVASAGNDVFGLANFGSKETVDGSSGDHVLDFSDKAENLVFFLTEDAILIGFGEQLIETAQILADGIEDKDYFSSQAIINNPAGIEKIIGGDFDDVFHVQGTAREITLDGGKGNDRYLLFAGTQPLSAIIDDRGNPWNSGDLIDVIGTTGDDEYISVSSTQITLGTNQSATYVAPPLDSNILAIRVRGDNNDPALGGKKNLGGDDTIRIESTDVAVPVRVETGLGDDTVIVGNDTVGTDGIEGILRPGLNAPFGTGPLVLVGGGGHDTVIIDDSADSSPNFGNSTAFLENRMSTDEPVEVGVISGLDMTLLQRPESVQIETLIEGGNGQNEVQQITVVEDEGFFTLALPDGSGGSSSSTDSIAHDAPGSIEDETVAGESLEAKLEALDAIGDVSVVTEINAEGHRVYTVTFLTPADTDVGQLIADEAILEKDGRVEFEGFEVIDVRMGTGEDTFTVGGGFNLGLPQDDSARGTSEDRQLVDTEFPKGRLADPADPDSNGIIAFVNSITGMTIISGGNENVTPATNEIQQIEIMAPSTGGSFTLILPDGSDNPPQTGPIGPDAPGSIDEESVAGESVEAKLEALDGIDDVSVVTQIIAPGHRVYTVTFLGELAGRDVETLIVEPDSEFADGGTHNVVSTGPMAAGSEGDAINIIASNDFDSESYDRGDLDRALGLLSTSTESDGMGIGSGINEKQLLTTDASAGDAGYFTLQIRFQETKPIRFGAGADDIRDALSDLSLIGAGNVSVTDVSTGEDTVFEIEFIAALAGLNQEQITARIVPLTILGGSGADNLNIQSIDATTFFLGGDDDDFVYLNVDVSQVSVEAPELPDPPDALTSNGVNARITLDGEGGSDRYFVNLIGGVTDSLVNVFDTAGSGFAVDTSADISSDELFVFGIDAATTEANPEAGDLFLLRAGAGADALAFIALLNQNSELADPDQPVERVNYNSNLEKITVDSRDGDDQFYVDDTRTTITVEGGAGDDFFQIGQLYKTRRTSTLAGVEPEDVFATTETTRGFLSNGISDPMTINGGLGEDEFIVFRNLAVLTLNGGDDNDSFLVQAFALVGSVDDERASTDLTGDGGADLIQYAVNAPVQVNGGDGLDTVIVIGTEFSDDFVVTDEGVFGAGLNVNFINIEFLEVDGAEGDDRFFILGTGETFVTKVIGSKGNDTFNVNGPTPENGVISNDLLGHSGIIEHFVSSDFSDDSIFQNLKVEGISANVADNDEPAIVVSQSDGFSNAFLGSIDDYTIVLTRPPRNNGTVSVGVTPPKGLVLLRETAPGEFTEVRVGGKGAGFQLKFNADNWYVPQTVKFRLDTVLLADEPDFVLPDLADIEHRVTADETLVPATNEIQQVEIVATGGTFTLTFEEPNGNQQTTGALEYNASGAVIEQALIDLDNIADGEVSVEKDGLNFTVTFSGSLGGRDVATLIVAPDNEFADGGTANVVSTDGTAVGRDGDTIKGVAGDSSSNGDYIAEEPGQNPSDEGKLVRTMGSEPFPAPGTEGFPEGLRGAYVTITSAPEENKEAVGQTRLILGHDPLDPTGTLILNQAWDVIPTGAQYQILLFAGVQVSTVRVAVTSPDTPAIIVEEIDAVYSEPAAEGESSSGTDFIIESGGGTKVAEGAGDSGTDFIQVRLSKAPDPGQTVTVDLKSSLIGSTDVGTDGQLRFFTVLPGDVLGDEITSLTFDENSFDEFQKVAVVAFDDGVVEGFHNVGLVFTASGGDYDGVSRTLVAGIADDDAPGVRIIESDGSTNVIEVDPELISGNGESVPQLDLEVFPAEDTYQVVLTKAPRAGETVTVTVDPRKTRTSRTGGIATFDEQVEVSLNRIDFYGAGEGTGEGTTLELTFTADNWDTPQTVYVRAIDDARVDGGDTKVFAPMLDLVNRIQGPLFVIGGEGTDRTGLLEREPIMLPGEINQRPSMGDVLAATEEGAGLPASVTIDPNELRESLKAQDELKPDDFGVDNWDDLGAEDLKDYTIEITTGSGKNKARIITSAVADSPDRWTLSLNREWFSPFSEESSIPNATSEYTIFETNSNFLIDEAEQVDILVVNDTDNINSFDDPALPAGTTNPFAEGRMFFDESTDFGMSDESTGEGLNLYRITGFGMGGDRIIGAGTDDESLQPGGITYEELEIVEVNLGDGNNFLDIEDTQWRDDGFQTWTMVNTGGGDDVVTVNLDVLEDGDVRADGRFALDTQGGNDTVDGTASTLPLIIFGGTGDDHIVGGDADDIVFGDRGQVDFLNDSGAIVTRLGSTPDQFFGQPSATSTGRNLVDGTAKFPVADPDKTADRGLAGLYVVITVGPGVGQQRLITGNSQTELFLDQPWDTGEGTGGMPNADSGYLILTTPEFQTDGVDHQPRFLRTIDPEAGGNDTITSTAGANIIFGGAGSDNLLGLGESSETIFGDNGQITFGGSENFDEGEESSTLSVNFTASDLDADDLFGEAGAPGARAGNWNNLGIDSPDGFGAGAGEFLYFDDGLIAPGIVIQWGRNLDSALSGEPEYDENPNIDPGGDPDLTLFDGYAEVGSRYTLGVDVEGMSNHFHTYDLYVYLDAGDGGSAAGSSVRAISDGSTRYFLNDPDGNTFAGTYIEVTATDSLAPGVGNYVVFRGLTSNRVEVRIESEGNDRQNLPVINGLQIVGQHHEIDRFETTDPLIGGDDIIRAGGGADLIFGGAGNDDIETFGSDARGAGDADIVVGDNAQATFMRGDLRELRTPDPARGEGFAANGDDRIVTGNGEDLVLGGIGNDSVDTGIVEAARDTQIISFNFNSETPKGEIHGLAGAAQAGNWNNLTGDRHVTFGDDLDETLLFNDGSTAGGVTIEWGDLSNDGRLGKHLENASHDEIVDPDTDNERLFEGYLHTYQDKIVGVNISGLNTHYPVYDVYVYLDMENLDSNDEISVHGISDGTTTYYLNDANGNTFHGEFIRADSTDRIAPAPGNYVVFRNLTADVATIRIGGGTAPDSWRARVPGIAAIQVVGGADKDQAAVPKAGIIGGDFDRDNVVGDNGVVHLLNGEIYELWTNQAGLGGDDTIIGGEGGDTLIGGSGNDYIGGESGHDLLLGDNVRLTYFAGEVVDIAGDRSALERLLDQRHQDNDNTNLRGIVLADIDIGGNDTLEGGRDDDFMFGQAGNDTYVFAGGGLGEDRVVEAGDGNWAGFGNDSGDTLDFSRFIGGIDLDLANERKSQINKGRSFGDINLALTIGSNTAFENVIGGEFDDAIYGNTRDNTIRGLGGNDRIEGLKGADTLSGDDGNDDIRGGEGADTLSGGAGDDLLRGNAGDDLLAGGSGDDVLDGGDGDDVLDGGPGDDNLVGVKRDAVVDQFLAVVVGYASADEFDRSALQLNIDDDIIGLTDENRLDAVAREGESATTFAIDDLIGITLGMRYGAAIPVGMESVMDHKRRPFASDALSTRGPMTPSAQQASPTLVFDEVLGEWISVEEADLLGQIDEGLSFAAASNAIDDARESAPTPDGTGLIDWSSQTGVSQLISENSI